MTTAPSRGSLFFCYREFCPWENSENFRRILPGTPESRGTHVQQCGPGALQGSVPPPGQPGVKQPSQRPETGDMFLKNVLKFILLYSKSFQKRRQLFAKMHTVYLRRRNKSKGKPDKARVLCGFPGVLPLLKTARGLAPSFLAGKKQSVLKGTQISSIPSPFPLLKRNQEFPLWLNGLRTQLVSMRIPGLAQCVKDLALP